MRQIDADLLNACIFLMTDLATVALDAGANPNTKYPNRIVDEYEYSSPLGAALWSSSKIDRFAQERLAMINLLLARGADPNQYCSTVKEVPIQLAAVANSPALLLALHQAGADLQKVTPAGSSLLRLTVMGGCPAAAATLLRLNAKEGVILDHEEIDDMAILCVKHFDSDLANLVSCFDQGLALLRINAHNTQATAEIKGWLAAYDARRAAESVLSAMARPV